MSKRQWIGVLGALALMVSAGQATAQGPIDIGGKASISAIGTITTQDPDEGGEFTSIVIGGLGAYTTQDGRFEFGGGLTISSIIADAGGQDFDFTTYSLTGEGRVNTNPMGPEENMIFYVGALAGLSLIDTNLPNVDEELGIFGPKFGGEFYVAPDMAIQIQDAVLFDTEKGVTNQLTIGFKLLFN